MSRKYSKAKRKHQIQWLENLNNARRTYAVRLVTSSLSQHARDIADHRAFYLLWPDTRHRQIDVYLRTSKP